MQLKHDEIEDALAARCGRALLKALNDGAILQANRVGSVRVDMTSQAIVGVSNLAKKKKRRSK